MEELKADPNLRAAVSMRGGCVCERDESVRGGCVCEGVMGECEGWMCVRGE